MKDMIGEWLELVFSKCSRSYSPPVNLPPSSPPLLSPFCSLQRESLSRDQLEKVDYNTGGHLFFVHLVCVAPISFECVLHAIFESELVRLGCT